MIHTSQPRPTSYTAPRTLVTDSIGFFLGMTLVGLFGTMGSHLRTLLGINTMELVWLMGLPALSGALLRVPFGAWVDLNGGKKPFTILLILAVIGAAGAAAVVGHADNMSSLTMKILLVLSALFAGAGVATFPVGFAQLHYLSPRRDYSSIMAAYGGIGTMGPGVAAIVVPIFAIHFRLQTIYLGWCVLLLCALVIYILVAGNAPYFFFQRNGGTPMTSREKAEGLGQELFPVNGMWHSVNKAMSYRRMWSIGGLYLCSFGFMVGLISLLPLGWNRLYGLDPVIGSLIGGAFGILSPLTRVLTGQLLGAQYTFGTNRIGLLMMIVSFFGLAFSPTIEWSLTSTFVLSVGMGLVNGSMFNYLPRYFGSALGGAIGWIGAIGIAGTTLLSVLWGANVDAYGNEGCVHTFLTMAITTAIIWGLDEWMREDIRTKRD